MTLPDAFISFRNLATAHIFQQALKSRHSTSIHHSLLNTWMKSSGNFYSRLLKDAMWTMVSAFSRRFRPALDSFQSPL